MKHRALLILVLAASGHLAAQKAVRVGLHECVTEALSRNPSLEASRARIDAAEARSRETGTALLPQLRFNGRAAELSSVPVFTIAVPPPVGPLTLFPSITESYSGRITVQQPVFTGFRLSKNRESAAYQEEASHEEFRRDREDLVLNVITAYWNLYRARQVQGVLQQSVEQVGEHLRDIRNFAAQGLATDADVMKVQVQHSETIVRNIEAKNSARVASMMLSSLMGRSLDTELIPADSLPVPALAVPDSGAALPALTERAWAQRPEVKTMELRRRMGEAGVTAARAGWYPQIALAAEYEYARPNQRIIPPKDRWDGTWNIGVAVQWNVWDWFATSYQSAQAEAALRQAEAGAAQTSDAVAIDVAQQYYAVEAAREKVTAAAEGSRLAAEVQRTMRDRFRQGLATNSDLLDAETMFLAAGVTHTNALVDYALAQMRLKRAVGEGL